MISSMAEALSRSRPRSPRTAWDTVAKFRRAPGWGRMAAAAGIPFGFQIDSDGPCDPCFFESIWEQREDYDVIYGKRKREDGFRRVVASMILRWMLRVRAGVDCVDPNVPYRLMRTKVCAPAFTGIPQDFFLANVGLAVLLRRSPGIRHGAVPIDFRERIGGEPSVPLGKFAEKALELWRQLEGGSWEAEGSSACRWQP
jgi:hypothetical protein